MTDITKELLEDLFIYDKEKGELFWRNDHTGKIKTGRKAGCKIHSGFVVRVRGKLLRLSKMIWCLETGIYPNRTIKTRDGNVHNTVFENLYIADNPPRKRVQRTVTFEDVKGAFKYNPEDGVFSFIEEERNSRIRLTVEGYVSCSFMGSSHFVHRLIWLYMTGAYPKKMIDHIDGNRSNNKWDNLREADSHQNGCNCVITKSNATGYKNVMRDKNSGLYKSHIMVHGKQHHLGYFDNPVDAYEAFVKASKDLHGEFSNVG